MTAGGSPTPTGVPASAREVAIKFCGLTRLDDARLAESLGAAYLGVILAPSPRRLSVDAAAALFEGLDAGGTAARAARPRRVGVFAAMEADEIAAIAGRLRLDVIQLHGGDDGSLVAALRERTRAQLWTVVHVRVDHVPGGDASGGDAPGGDASPAIDAHQLALAERGDGLLLDARVDGMLGGTGRTFDWGAGRAAIAPLRTGRSIILAGGLRPENVARAITVFAPDVVDVSSGVESAPGVKDPARMRAFADAVRHRMG